MKKTFVLLGAALLALLLAAGALAADPAAAAPYECAAPEGMKILRVTSSLSLAADDPDLTTLFDADRETGVPLSFAPEVPHAFTVFMSVGVPQTLNGFALSLEGDTGTEISVRLLAAKSAADREWTLLASTGFTAEESGWSVSKLENNAEQYAFYCLVINFAGSDALTLNEVRLFKPESEPEYRFEGAPSVELGEMPAIEVVTVTAPPVRKITPRRFLYPGRSLSGGLR